MEPVGRLTESLSNDYLHAAIFSEEHKRDLGWSVTVISIVMIAAALASHYLQTKDFMLSHQLVGTIMGVLTVFFAWLVSGTPVTTTFLSIYNILTIYYTLMIVKFVYSMDSYAFIKSFSQILIIGVIGWMILVISFGFLLFSFAGELGGLSLTNLILIGVIFTPMEMPSTMFNIEQIKLIEVVMQSESVMNSILSMVTLNVLFGAMGGIFNQWYQPLFVLLRMVFVGVGVGIPCGLIAGALIPRFCNTCLFTVSTVLTSNFILFHCAQYFFGGSGGTCCFLYILMISRRRLEVHQQLDNEVATTIHMIFNILSTIISFLVVCEVLPHFLSYINVMSACVSLALYICVNACRLVFFIGISPLLSRLGYGFNFRTLVTMVWCVKKGPMCFIMLSLVVREGYTSMVPKDQLILGMNYLFLINIVNELSAFSILKKMCISYDESIISKPNTKNAFRYLEQKRANQLAIMRMNRFYNDANWKIINTITDVLPQINDVSKIFEDFKFEKKPPYCTSCKQKVAYEPSQREYQDMLNEVRVRILHACRVSFAKQFEKGFVGIAALRLLNHLLDLAMESKDYIIKLDPLVNMLTETHYNKYLEKLRNFMNAYDRKQIRSRYIPSHPKLYNIMTNTIFHWFFDVISIVQLAIAINCYYYEKRYLSYVYIFLLFSFYIEFIIKVCGYTSKDVIGFKRYFRQFWNCVDFFFVVLTLIDFSVLMFIVNFAHDLISQEFLTHLITVNYCLRMARVCRFLRWIPKLQIAIVVRYDKRVNSKLKYAYMVGRAVVISYEEVNDILHTLSDEPKIMKDVHDHLQEERNMIARRIGLIEMEHPWVIMTLKTRQAITCTVMTMRNTINALRMEGLMDNHEYNKLHEAIVERLKAIYRKKIIADACPRSIFYEMPWIDGDQDVFDYLFENTKLRVWGIGEVIYTRGDVAKEVAIIVTGMLRLVYNPQEATLQNLRINGHLPVKDQLKNPVFDMPIEEYIFKGNSIGELAVLTGRPYCCDIYAEAPTQAFIISKEFIFRAMDMNPDPIKGLFSRIWMHIASNMAKRILKEVPLYAGMDNEQIQTILERGFVPKMDGYHVFSSNDAVDDIILIEGTVNDLRTGELFVGPCVIPRGSPDFVLPDILENRQRPKILIVPSLDMDPYEVMMFSEAISQLKNDVPDNCFLSKQMRFKKRKTRSGRTVSEMSTTVHSKFSKMIPSITKILEDSNFEAKSMGEFFSVGKSDFSFASMATLNRDPRNRSKRSTSMMTTLAERKKRRLTM